MDDGGNDGVGGFLLFTNAFTKEVLLLIKVLKERFDLDTVLRNRGNGQYAIALGRTLYTKLRKIILFP